MNRYRLNSESNIQNTLSKELTTLSKNCRKDGFCSHRCHSHWVKTLQELTTKQFEEHISWDNIYKYERITSMEAIFLLLELPTKFLIETRFSLYDFKCYPEYEDFFSSTFECRESALKQIFFDADCIKLLNRSNFKLADEWNWQPGMYSPDPGKMCDIDAKDFIEWCLKVDLVRHEATPEKTKDFGFSKYNEYRSWAITRNTVELALALDNYPKKNPLSSLLANDKTPFYRMLLDNLVDLEPDKPGKPSPKTLQNYHSEYKNFKSKK